MCGEGRCEQKARPAEVSEAERALQREKIKKLQQSSNVSIDHHVSILV